MFSRLLIANRGEIAIRIAQAAAELDIQTISVFAPDDARSLHVRRTDESVELPGRGVAAYVDVESIVASAVSAGCDALHPGYGFLSESPELARACARADVAFVGPRPEMLDLFGDKARSRGLARECDVPQPRGTDGSATVEQARELLGSLDGGAIMIKAVCGGGGRGMRAVRGVEDLEEAFARCASEARTAFGSGELYAEELVPRARHVEVQIVGDHAGAVTHLWERDCTIQRRHQKLIELAPSPSLHPELRERILEAALTMSSRVRYDSLGTFEFLIDAGHFDRPDGRFVFIETNPRLQVEHTVTEQVTGVDLVQAQLRIAAGATLAELGLAVLEVPVPTGYAVQLRVNLETMDRAGAVTPSGGTIDVFEPPTGPGIRVDGFGYAGYRPNAAFDPLLAKLIVHSPTADYAGLMRRARRAVTEFRIEGIDTNLPLLEAVLASGAFERDELDTTFIDANAADLVEAAARNGRGRFSSVTEVGHNSRGAKAASDVQASTGTEALAARVRGTVVSIDVGEGDAVTAGQPVAVIEAMKMEHVIVAESGGIVHRVVASPGETVEPEAALLFVEPSFDAEASIAPEEEDVDLEAIRPDLAELRARKRLTTDAMRRYAVEKRRAIGHRMARENIAALVDPGSFYEYGPLALAAQRGRRTHEELLQLSPADGLIGGLASINGDRFDDERSRAMVISYDWTVFAGTQGMRGHKKTDRLVTIADRLKLPVVLFAEGGGGRPGDTEMGPTGLDILTFHYFARLSGQAPTIGVTSRFCFAGNAALLGICDVIVATEDSNIGMGGPAMVEGGGLGAIAPEEIGPAAVQSRNGVIDLLVADEAEAVLAVKQYLSYFQGSLNEWGAADQRLLRSAVPENRLRVYDIRRVIELLADTGSVLELRREFGLGMITALIRIEGRPVGVIANNPGHLGGAVDADAADKGARFMQLCDAYGLPILSLCDTPGFMVGPEAESAAQVRHVSRLFVTAANVTVPMFAIVLRKGYGLGAQGSVGGSFHAPVFLVSWPTGEFGGMGLEGHVRLAFRNELKAIGDPVGRQAEYERLVDEMYEKGAGVSLAEHFEIDDVIDPADSRGWIMRGLRSSPPRPPSAGKHRPNIDTW